MAIYYVRKTGSDAAAGTSAGAAWLTIGKALGAAGIASGDTVYIGAGIYREVVTVAMTSATVETKVIGDVSGAFTGDAGEVQWSAYLKGDYGAASGTTLLNISARDFLTFQYINFIGGGAATVTATSATSTDIVFYRCNFTSSGNPHITHTTGANVLANWVIDSCKFINAGSANALTFTLTRPATADFDYNIIVRNCFFFGSSNNAVGIAQTGANTFNGGGVVVRNCTYFGGGNFVNTNSANLSTTIPALVYNCLIYGNGNVGATSAGQIVEDYNLWFSTNSRSSVTAGTHSIVSICAPLFFTGSEYDFVGANLMPFFSPRPGSPFLGFGNQASSPTTDILGAARPSGLVFGSSGTATSGAAGTITDSGKTWGTNSFIGYTVKIISGTGSGQTKTINANTATALTVDGNWKTNPDNTSVYEIYVGAMSSSGKATSGAATTMTDSGASWATNMWTGYTLSIDGGTGSGQTKVVVSNTATAITVSTWTTNPDSTSTYKLFRGTDENTLNAGVGCYELGQTAVKELTTVRTGSNAVLIPGAGYHDFFIPVDASSTTVTVYVQWNAAYSGTKPSMKVVNGEECGVSAATATATGSASSWEQLSLNFTPTSKGIVTIRLISSTTTPTGNTFWDDFNVT